MKLPWEKLEKLKRPHKMGILFLTILLLGAVFYFLLYSPMQVQIADIQADIQTRKGNIVKYKQQVAELADIERQLEEVRLQYQFASRFLPEQKEVGQLLIQISEARAAASLRVLLFEPQPQVEFQEFYAELFYNMDVEGPYLNVADFFYRLGTMDRIVNVENVNISQPNFIDGELYLRTSCTLKAFRFLTEEEQAAQEEARAAAARQ